MKIRLVGAELFHAGGRTDRQTDMTKLILAFGEFCERIWELLIPTLEFTWAFWVTHARTHARQHTVFPKCALEKNVSTEVMSRKLNVFSSFDVDLCNYMPNGYECDYVGICPNYELWTCALLSTTQLFIHSFHWHVQNATIPCSQELLPFLSVIYSLLPPFSTN